MAESARPFDLFPRDIFDGFMPQSTPTEPVKKRVTAMLDVDDEPERKRARGPVKLATFEVK